jgi:predicted ribosomally synthesized peptide with SipW-like signal peptide
MKGFLVSGMICAVTAVITFALWTQRDQHHGFSNICGLISVCE